jgi:hypothetical protein
MRRSPWGVRVAAGVVLLIGALAAILVPTVVVLHLIARTAMWLDLGTDFWWFIGVGTLAAISGLGSGIGLLRGNQSAYRTVLAQAAVGLAICLIRAVRDGVDLGLALGIAIAATLVAALALPSSSRAHFHRVPDARPADAGLAP